jgi:hypothetical protein
MPIGSPRYDSYPGRLFVLALPQRRGGVTGRSPISPSTDILDACIFQSQLSLGDVRHRVVVILELQYMDA